MKNYKDLIKAGFDAIVTNQTFDEATVEKYFSKDYKQFVDGHELDYNGFCQHMKVQKAALKELSIDFKTIVQEGNILFSHHLVHMITKEDRHATLQVIAEFHIMDDKVNYCNELTRMLSGDHRDSDLGSRQ